MSWSSPLQWASPTAGCLRKRGEGHDRDPRPLSRGRHRGENGHHRSARHTRSQIINRTVSRLNLPESSRTEDRGKGGSSASAVRRCQSRSFAGRLDTGWKSTQDKGRCEHGVSGVRQRAVRCSGRHPAEEAPGDRRLSLECHLHPAQSSARGLPDFNCTRRPRRPPPAWSPAHRRQRQRVLSEEAWRPPAEQ